MRRLLFLAIFALFPVMTTAAHANHVNISVTPNPVTPSSSYVVNACELHPAHVYTVDTNGPNFFYTRIDYVADSQGCVGYSDVSGSILGEYGITLQESRGAKLDFISNTVFLVQ